MSYVLGVGHWGLGWACHLRGTVPDFGVTNLSTTDLLARFIAIDTVSRNSNLALADAIADLLDRPGVTITRVPSPDGAKANLIIQLGPDIDPDTRDGLVLSGHMDVVPADEPEWTTDPFTLTDLGDTWAGRGTADMKGFLAVAVERARRIDPARLRHPLVLLFTYDEELGTLGAHDLVSRWEPAQRLPRAALIGEPTELRPVRLHKGHLKLRLTFAGVPAHSGYPHLGRNAIEPAGRAIVALSDLRADLERERTSTSEHFAEVPWVPLNVAQVEGGVAINVVPDRCVIDVGIRLLPGMLRDAMIARVRETVAHAVGKDNFTLEMLGDSPPLHLDASCGTWHRMAELAGPHPGESVSFATDAGWFQTVGMECVICGPGTIDVAHKPNETVPKADLAAAARLLDRVLQEWVLSS